MFYGLILRNWKLAAGGIALISVLSIIVWQGHKIRYLRSEGVLTSAALESYRETLEATQAAHSRALESLQRERSNEKIRVQQARDIINGLSKLDDGPVAPVLRHALDQLHAAGGRSNTSN